MRKKNVLRKCVEHKFCVVKKMETTGTQFIYNVLNEHDSLF